MLPPKSPYNLKAIPLISKFDWILKHVKDKEVLHAGATDFPLSLEKASSGNLLHLKLQGQCKKLIGIDSSEEGIEQLKSNYGIFDIIKGNIENLSDIFSQNSFDTILAGDVIEHISNIGSFYIGAREILRPNGQIIITVPNSFSIKKLLSVLFLRQERTHYEHLYYFSPMNLGQAAYRFSFEIVESAAFIYDAHTAALNKFANKIIRLILFLTRNNYLADELAIVMVKN